MAVDERVPMRTIFEILSITETDELYFLARNSDDMLVTIHHMRPRIPMCCTRSKDDSDMLFSATPHLYLVPDALYIMLRAAEKPNNLDKPFDPRWATTWLYTRIYNASEMHFDMQHFRKHGTFSDENSTPKRSRPDWEDALLVPKPDACESVRFAGDAPPSKELTRLLKGYDKSEYYPGFLLSTESQVTFGSWIKVLAEMQSIDTFGGTFNLPMPGFADDLGVASSCEHVIVVE